MLVAVLPLLESSGFTNQLGEALLWHCSVA